MTRNQIKEVVRKYLNNPKANDTQIADALGMTKGNFSKYTDPLSEGSIKTVKAWCFDNFDEVIDYVPSEWLNNSDQVA